MNRFANFPGFLTTDQCKEVIEYCYTLTSEPGTVNKNFEYKKDLCNTVNRWIDDHDHWLYRKIYDASVFANTGFKYQMYSTMSKIQFSEYDETYQGYFKWHTDINYDEDQDFKLSFSVQLTDSCNYEGGELQFFNGIEDPVVAPKGVGDLIIFPSFLWHQVTPVTKGRRNSLVGWFSGPTFT